ncbi:MAG: putative prolin-rich exported protein [Steroidobacteraceae bacterium]|jgi:hypothetical protein|nr:putative prolin-rich exported protein [Steroidobacteraceae bacterium]
MGTMAPTTYRRIVALTLSLLGAMAMSSAYAQENDLPEADPPERAARLSYLQGDVSLQPADEQEWAPAILNRPLTTGDKVWTERGARAEIEVGPAAVRLDSDTGFSFLNVDDDTIQMRMTAGVLNVSVRHLDDNEHIEIDTPNVAVILLRAGSYRLEVNDAGDRTVVKVSEGAADATGSGQDAVVHAGQAVTFTGVDDVVAQLDRLGSADEFDSWTRERDERDERASTSRTAQYVSPDVTGYEDLDDHGSWSSEAEYGYVWTPRNVAVDWSPYRYGRWVWVSPWGWTWIDDSPWGYAPFHYGRWAHVRNRWCWVPGPRHLRPVYSPAMVVWVGGHGSRISWFPLGPREVYVPGRRHSRHYFDRVNHSNTQIVDRRHLSDVFENRARNVVYRNRSVSDAITAAARSQFTSGSRIGQHRIREHDVSRGVVSAAAPRISPVRESRLGGPGRAQVRLPPQAIENRQVVVKRDPPAPMARLARAARSPAEVGRAPPDRVMRGQGDNRSSFAQGRTDRPARTDRQSNESVRSPVRDPGSIAERVREDRDRQVREHQQREYQQRASQQREQQQREADDQRRRQIDGWRDQPQDRDRARRSQDAMREAAARQIERDNQRERSMDRAREQRRTEQPRIERSREREQPRMEQRPREQPRMEQRREQPRMEQPRARPPQQERASPPPRQSAPEPRPQPRESRQQDGNRAQRR